MTVAELTTELQKLPQHLRIFVENGLDPSDLIEVTCVICAENSRSATTYSSPPGNPKFVPLGEQIVELC